MYIYMYTAINLWLFGISMIYLYQNSGSLLLSFRRIRVVWNAYLRAQYLQMIQILIYIYRFPSMWISVVFWNISGGWLSIYIHIYTQDFGLSINSHQWTPRWSKIYGFLLSDIRLMVYARVWDRTTRRHDSVSKQFFLVTMMSSNVLLATLWCVNHCSLLIPSGNLLHSYWKWPFIVDFPIKKWWIFP